MRKLAVDGFWMRGNHRGMGKYAHSIIGPVQKKITLLHPDLETHSLKIVNVLRGILHPVWEQVYLPIVCHKQQFDLLLCPYNTAPVFLPKHTKLLLVVHDLIFLEPFKKIGLESSLKKNLAKLYRQLVFPNSLRKADLIVCVSEYTKQSLIERFDVQPSKISVIPNSISQDWQPNQRKNASTCRTKQILSVTGSARSKNLPNLLIAISKLVSEQSSSYIEIRVKIVGLSEPEIKKQKGLTKRLNIEANVDFLPFLSPKKLREVYSNSDLLVVPSLMEGFGIPAIEAMASGLPVIASNTTSLPEVIGDAGLYFDPLNPEEIAAQILLVLSDKRLSNVMKKRGLKQVVQFREKTVQSLVSKFWHPMM